MTCRCDREHVKWTHPTRKTPSEASARSATCSSAAFAIARPAARRVRCASHRRPARDISIDLTPEEFAQVMSEAPERQPTT